MRSFKQFLLEAESTATPANVDGSYVVGAVNFDNENGMGSTPNTQNVMYKA